MRASSRRRAARYQLVVDDGFDRAWRRVGLALDRVGFTVVDRDRSKGTYFVRYADPEIDGAKKDKGLPRKLQFWKPTPTEGRAVPDHGGGSQSAQPRDRAGPERRPGQDARPARRSSRCCATSSSSGAARMRFASLGSGSEGNGLVVEAGGTRVLIDCGFGVRGTDDAPGAARPRAVVARRDPRHPRALRSRRRRARVRGAPRHSGLGHVRHAGRGLGTVRGHDRTCTASTATTAFAIDALEIVPFPVPHDAREPVQYVVGDGARRLGVLTDLGVSTAHVEACLSGCDALVLECNHDLEMLGERRLSVPAEAADRRALRPSAQRGGGGDPGARSTRRGSQHIIAAHLSQQNNTPELARAALAAALGCPPDWIGIADQATGFDWREMSQTTTSKGRRDGTAAGALQGERPRRSMRPTTRITSSCTTATTCRRSTA